MAALVFTWTLLAASVIDFRHQLLPDDLTLPLLWLGLGVGRSVGFAVAAGEVLLAALMMTGLGDGIWYLVPCSWGIRMVSMGSMLLWQAPLPQAAVLKAELWRGTGAAVALTAAMAVFLFCWFARWEGRREEE